MRKSLLFALVLSVAAAVSAQTEILTNATVIEMTKAGLSPEIISSKIVSTGNRFAITASDLIEMKQAGVEDAVIQLMMERAEKQLPGVPPRDGETRVADTTDAEAADPGTTEADFDPKEALARAKTIALHKSSAQPSRQNLEKALLKNEEFKKHNLTILRYKDDADLFVEIGFVSGSWITHRYVYRIYDRRSGAVLAAGETTSWGSLSENLARHISRSLNQISGT